MATADTPHILRLPPELTLRVSSYLTTVELGAFRRCCKPIENALFDSFAREFFTKRQFMLEHVSLEALVGIANHKTLSPYLSEVIISLDTFPSFGPHAEDGAGARRTAGYLERQVLLETGRAMDMLTEAFTGLKNLRVLGLRDYEGRGRVRDGNRARWRSYGWSSGLGDAARNEVRYGLSVLATAPARAELALLFGALGRAQSKPEAFEAFLRRQRLPLPSFDALRHISEAWPALAGLKRLMLNIEPQLSHQDALFHQQGTQYNGLIECLTNAFNLEHLRINFSSEHQSSGGFLQQLTEMLDTSTSPSQPAMLSRLRSLDLGMLHAYPETILSIVCNLKLDTIAFYRMALTCKDQADFDADPDIWARFLTALGQNLSMNSELKSIYIGKASQVLTQQTDIAVRQWYVEFGSSITVDENGVKKASDLRDHVSFRKRYGDSACQWLQDLALKVWIPNRHVEPDASDADEMDDDDDAAVSHEGSEEEEDEDDYMAAEEDGEEDIEA